MILLLYMMHFAWADSLSWYDRHPQKMASTLLLEDSSFYSLGDSFQWQRLLRGKVNSSDQFSRRSTDQNLQVMEHLGYVSQDLGIHLWGLFKGLIDLGWNQILICWFYEWILYRFQLFWYLYSNLSSRYFDSILWLRVLMSHYRQDVIIKASYRVKEVICSKYPFFLNEHQYFVSVYCAFCLYGLLLESLQGTSQLYP